MTRRRNSLTVAVAEHRVGRVPLLFSIQSPACLEQTMLNAVCSARLRNSTACNKIQASNVTPPINTTHAVLKLK